VKDSRGIGNRFENEICLALSQWLAPESPNRARIVDLPFRRRTTSREPLEGHWNGKGDILWRPDVVCPFAIECKFGYGFDLDGLINAPKWIAWEWWAQAKRQALPTHAHPLLIASRARMKPITFMLMETYECLRLNEESDLTALIVQHPRAQPDILAVVPLENLTMVEPRIVRSVGKLRPLSADTR